MRPLAACALLLAAGCVLPSDLRDLADEVRRTDVQTAEKIARKADVAEARTERWLTYVGAAIVALLGGGGAVVAARPKIVRAAVHRCNEYRDARRMERGEQV